MMDDQSRNSGNLFKKVFKQYIEKKIEQEYENYFKNILKEATENVNNDQANMREVVGIKVGLEYIR
jgi:flagellar hook-basal body complex protein FliE